MSVPQGGVADYADVAVAQQPMSTAIEADQYSSQLYSSGVFIASCGTRLDHDVSAVGYGCEAGHRLLESEEFVGKFVG